MIEQKLASFSEADLSLRETARLLKASWSLDIGGFIMVGIGPAELMGADDVYYRFKHCGDNPSDTEYNFRLRQTIIEIASPIDLVTPSGLV